MKLRVRYRPRGKYRFQKFFKLSKEFRVLAPVTRRTVEVAKAFGLGIDEEKVFSIFKDFEVEIKPGDIVYVTGESGGGKTTLLYMLVDEMCRHKEFQPIITDNNIRIRKNQLVIHGIGRTFQEALEILNYTGLNDAFIFLRRFRELSDGQKYRYKLAKALSRNVKTLIFDEFCATLDRETAKIVAYLIQKICRKKGVTLIVATTHEDLIEDVNPNILIRKGLGPEVKVEYFKHEPKECSVLKDFVIEEGSIEDLRSLEFWHYKGEFKGWRSTIYHARIGDKTIGVVVYVYPHIYLKARFNTLPHLKEIHERSRRDYLDYINRCFRRLARIIVHPKYRGIGLAVRIVRKTMSLLNVPYVECVAVMPRYNPFLKHAGMIEVKVEPSRILEHIYMTLEKMGFNLDMIQSRKYNLRILKTMKKQDLKKLQKIILRMYNPKFKKDVKLVKKITRGDVEAMADALKKTPIPTTYYI